MNRNDIAIGVATLVGLAYFISRLPGNIVWLAHFFGG